MILSFTFFFSKYSPLKKLHFCLLKRLLQQKGHKRIEQRIQEAAKSQVDKAHQTRA